MKMNHFTSLLLAAVCFGSFVSCDEDDMKGMVLSGDWEGNFGMYYTIDDGYHYKTYDSYDSDLSFIPYSNSYSSGYGYETDYYKFGPYDEIYHAFTWEVRNGTIYIDYRSPSDAHLSTYMRDYHMTNDELTGYFGDTGSRFTLYKYHDQYDWKPYINSYGDYNRGYGYGYHDSYYYAHTRGADSTEVKPIKVVHYGNRYIDGKAE